jgi:four helix bundle protein
MSKGFEDLEVWQLAVKFSIKIYAITDKFPKTEQFGLTNQIRRSAVYIASNIAEGSAKGSNADFARFVGISQGSTAELKTQLIIAKGVGYLEENYRIELIEYADRIAQMLKKLRQSLTK